VFLFGDDLRVHGAYGPLEAVSLLVMFIGAVVLCQSPLVSGVKGEGAEYSELLTVRHRARQVPEAGTEPAIQHAPNA
jgi:hypothetical protein